MFTLHRPCHIIGAEEVHIWNLLADGIPPTLLDDLGSMLSSDEKTRAVVFRHERDRVLFVLSRVLLRTVLASYLDCGIGDIRLIANEFGKPVLATTPPARAGGSLGTEGSLGLHFNLTHSRGAVALAVGKREVGVDVEERRRKVEYLALAERFFAPSEWRYLQTLADDDVPPAFFAIWTLKEAFVKGIGRGLSFPLDAFCFDLAGDRLLRFRPLADFVAPDWHFQQFKVGDHHCGAVAVQGGPARIEQRDWASAFLFV
jgi:4'-phosphopantetheinyl transferase